MKLKNKKTGENYETTMPIVFNIKTSDGGEHTVSCESIKELNEKWEDCNGYYYIGDGGDVNLSRTKYRLEHEDEAHEEIGNYFETEEEVELAVRKLKAWKRLKDKGFRFIDHTDFDDGNITIWGKFNKELDVRDVDLLFGGEE